MSMRKAYENTYSPKNQKTKNLSDLLIQNM